VRKVYRGKDVEVSFDLDVCVHIGECLRGDRDVFKLDRRPWVLPDAGSVDDVARVIERCPAARSSTAGWTAARRSVTKPFAWCRSAMGR
jgi:uncharacterized Fe-S cluster protein YjdI